MTKDAWILEGDLGPYDVVDVRLRAADTIILLDFSFVRCAWRAIRRSRERMDFWRWLIAYRRLSRPLLMAAIARHAPSAVLHILRNPRAVRRFLSRAGGATQQDQHHRRRRCDGPDRGARDGADHRLRSGGRIATVCKVSRGRRVPRSGGVSPLGRGRAPGLGSASNPDVDGASADATGSLMGGVATAVRSDSLPSASRTASTVSRVDASAATTTSVEAPRTSASTSIGVSGSVGVSSVDAPRLAGGRNGSRPTAGPSQTRHSVSAAHASRPAIVQQYFSYGAVIQTNRCGEGARALTHGVSMRSGRQVDPRAPRPCGDPAAPCAEYRAEQSKIRRTPSDSSQHSTASADTSTQSSSRSVRSSCTFLPTKAG